MNFLKKPWVLGGFIGLVFNLILIFSAFFQEPEGAVFGLILLPAFVGVGALAGAISPTQNIIIKSTFIGGFIGFIFDLILVFFISPDVTNQIGATIFGLILLPAFVGVGALVGAIIGFVIFIILRK